MRLKTILAGTATLLTLLAANTAKADTTKATTTATTAANTTATSSAKATSESQVTLRSGSTTTESTASDTSANDDQTASSTTSSSTGDQPATDQDGNAAISSSSHSASADETDSGSTVTDVNVDESTQNQGSTTKPTTNATSSTPTSTTTANQPATQTTNATDTTVVTASDNVVDTTASQTTQTATTTQVQAKSAAATTANQQTTTKMYSAVTTSLKGTGALTSGTLAFSNFKALMAKATVVVTGLTADDATITDTTGNTYTTSETLDAYSHYIVKYAWSIPDGEVINDGDSVTITLPSNTKATAADFDVTDFMTGEVIGTAVADENAQTATLTFNDYYATNPGDSRKGNLLFYVSGTTTSAGDSTFKINKIGWVDGTNKTTGYWQMIINPFADTWHSVTVVDNMGLYQTYNQDMWVETGIYNDDNSNFVATAKLVAGTDYTLTTDGNVLTLTFLTPVTTAINIEYTATLQPNHFYINSAVLNYTPATGVPGIANVNATAAQGGSGAADSLIGSALLTKTDATTGNPVVGAVYSLYASDGTTLLRSGLTTDAQGQLTIGSLVSGDYVLKETRAPDDYALNPTAVTFTVPAPSNLSADEPTSNIVVPVATTDATVERTAVKVTKQWVAVPTGTTTPSVTVTLYRQSSAVSLSATTQTLTLTAANQYQGTFSNLPVTDNYGNPYTYTVVETPVAGYVSTQTTSGDTVTLTNTYQYGSLTVTKVGSDDSATGLAGATFTLLDNAGQIIATQTTGSTGSLIFAGLQQGVYTLHETTAPAGYQLAADQTVTIDETTQYNVALTVVDQKIDQTTITVNKHWAGLTANTVTPAVTITLMANDTSTGQTLTLTNANGYTGQFTDLDTTDVTGTAITYTVVETPVTGYTTTGGTIVNGVADFTNTLQTGSLVVTKVDQQTQATLANATFSLVDRTGQTIAAQTTDATGQATFTGLATGQYTLHELTAPTGYDLAADQAVTIDATASAPVTITVADTKTVVPTTTLTVNKHWAETTATTVTPSVTVTLYANGTSTGQTLTLSVATHYTGQFTDLAVADTQGQTIQYTIVETPVVGYQLTSNTVVDGVADLTNTLITTPVTPTTTLTVNKHWAGVTATTVTPAVTVTLYANGTATGQTLMLTKANGYTSQFSDLAVTDAAGQTIQYTVVETPVAGYTLTAQTTTNGSVDLTNTLVTTPVTPTGSLTVIKVDDQTQAKLAGATFKVVNAAGQTVATGTTDVSGQVSFTDLTAGTYQVIETVAPAGYTLNATATTITVSAEQAQLVTIADTKLPVTPVDPIDPVEPTVPVDPTEPSTPDVITPTTPSVPNTPAKPTVPTVKVIVNHVGQSTFGEYAGGITPDQPTPATAKQTLVKLTPTPVATRQLTAQADHLQGASQLQAPVKTTSKMTTLPQTNDKPSRWAWLGWLSLVILSLGYGLIKQRAN
ncbi:SpaA isopeptide-forming pilin-related protein [Lactiplantibacillus daowaiensis]|uniref:SpaA isopeptide-forming pilin-related protein n=1 Tax=Lactiplantibacillus daowaiensis TaxID=2559918 RepID=A0ABW1S4F0_9LACO|nr:SpaA isopeptide-forming pilin-related protein [Lactiplantibacillus daowaiensis]